MDRELRKERRMKADRERKKRVRHGRVGLQDYRRRRTKAVGNGEGRNRKRKRSGKGREEGDFERQVNVKVESLSSPNTVGRRCTT